MPLSLRLFSIWITLVVLAFALWLLVAAVRRRRWTSLFQVVPALGLLALGALALALLVPYIFGLNAPHPPHPFFNRLAAVPAGTVVYYQSSPNRGDNQLILYGVEGQTGKFLWQRTVPGIDTTVAPTAGVIYAASFQPGVIHGVQVLALDGATGSVLWQHIIPGSYVPSASLLAGDTLLLGTTADSYPDRQQVFALRPSDGAQLWSVQVGSGSDSTSTPRLFSGSSVLYVQSSTFVLQARRLTDGNLLWTRNSIQSQVVAGPDAVYDLSASGSVTAYRAQTGAQLWQYGNNDLSDTAGVFSSGTLYVTARHNGPITDASGNLINPETVYALDAATGQPRWTFATHSSSPGQLAGGSDTVYIRADDGIHALRASDGAHLWHSDPHSGRTFSLLAPSTGLLAPSAGSTLYLTSLRILPHEAFNLFAPQQGQPYLYAVNVADGSDNWGVPVGPVLSFGGSDD
jgi:outer membrane protein assembly factor BamB